MDATRLNKRTGVPISAQVVTIPFGALIENLEQGADFDRFTYLGEPYQCAHDALKAAIRPARSASAEGSPNPSPQEIKEPGLRWQVLDSSQHTVMRTKVPGGWLVLAAGSLAFYPDPGHVWDGKSLP